MSNLHASDDLAQHRRSADRVRALALADVAQGRASVDEIIRRCAQPESTALLKIRLTYLLMAQPDMGSGQAKRRIQKLALLTGTDVAEAPGLNLAWLLDSRSGGKRYTAWLDAVATDINTTLWDGWPFAPRPADFTLEASLQ